MRTSPTPESPSSVRTRTKVRLRQGVPTTKVLTSLIFILYPPLLCVNEQNSGTGRRLRLALLKDIQGVLVLIEGEALRDERGKVEQAGAKELHAIRPGHRVRAEDAVDA